MPGRKFSTSGSYRYGFNGKENDNDVKDVEGSQQDYGLRIYDPRLGRFLSVDPLTHSFPWYTPYQFAGNIPTIAIDLDGAEEYIIIKWVHRGQLRGIGVIKVPDDKYVQTEKYKSLMMRYRIAEGDLKSDLAALRNQKSNRKTEAAINEKQLQLDQLTKARDEAQVAFKNSNKGKAIVEVRETSEVDYVSAETIMSALDNIFDNLSAYVKEENVKSLTANDQQMTETGMADRLKFDDPNHDGSVKNMTAIPIRRFYNVTFSTGSSELDDEGKSLVRSLAATLLTLPYLNVTIVGHTDNVGSSGDNKLLSLERAKSVRSHLMGLSPKIDKDRISTDGQGAANPITSNENEEGRKTNRRIEVVQNN